MAWGQRVDRTGELVGTTPHEVVVAYVGDEAVASMPEPDFDRLVSKSESAADYERRLREAGFCEQFPDPAPKKKTTEKKPAA